MTSEDDYLAYLDDVFDRAWHNNGFDVLCTLLRVGGWCSEDWDPFEQSIAAFDEFNWLLAKASAERSDPCAARVALLIYCQAVEMTAPHVILANLLRVVGGERYVVDPFAHLIRRPKKQNVFVAIPPSAKKKFDHIKSLAKAAGEQRVPAIVDSFFDDRVRNAFSHSDYVLTDQPFAGPRVAYRPRSHATNYTPSFIAALTSIVLSLALIDPGCGASVSYLASASYLATRCWSSSTMTRARPVASSYTSRMANGLLIGAPVRARSHSMCYPNATARSISSVESCQTENRSGRSTGCP